MGYLNGKTVYLCGSIADSKDDGVGWRDAVTPILSKFGVIVDDPTKKTINGEVGSDKAHFKKLMESGDFERVKKEFFPIVRRDLRSVDKCDFVIFFYDTKAKLVGSIHELLVAHWQRKPILMFVPPQEVKDMNPWILTFIKNGCTFTNWYEMGTYLKDVDNNVFNTSYWSLG